MTQTDEIRQVQEAARSIRQNTGRVIVGKEKIIDLLMVALLCEGHLLFEDVPGIGKTTMAKALAKSLGCTFQRIQFTPDLLPSDITGITFFNHKKSEFEFRPGPLLSQVVLADEINRTPPKTQAALLEAMQEKSVTAAGVTHKLSLPFFVLATQNPIEQEGTYPLPEAQLDRFMFHIALDYPSFKEELQVVKNTTSAGQAEVNKLLNASQIVYFQQLVRNIPVTDNVLEYAVKLVSKTRPHGELASPQVKRLISWGAGPRASQFLILGAKCHAVISGKYSPDIEDVQAIAKPVLRHRIVRSYHAEAEGLTTDDIIEQLF